MINVAFHSFFQKTDTKANKYKEKRILKFYGIIDFLFMHLIEPDLNPAYLISYVLALAKTYTILGFG